VENPGGDFNHGGLDNLIAMSEAVAMAYAAILGPDLTVTEALRNWIANVLSSLVTLYVLSHDRQHIQALDQDELRGAVFADGGRTISFSDGRASIGDLFLTRTALKRAMEAMQRPVEKSGV
jgi:hypothetical protein